MIFYKFATYPPSSLKPFIYHASVFLQFSCCLIGLTTFACNTGNTRGYGEAKSAHRDGGLLGQKTEIRASRRTRKRHPAPGAKSSRNHQRLLPGAGRGQGQADIPGYPQQKASQRHRRTHLGRHAISGLAPLSNSPGSRWTGARQTIRSQAIAFLGRRFVRGSAG